MYYLDEKGIRVYTLKVPAISPPRRLRRPEKPKHPSIQNPVPASPTHQRRLCPISPESPPCSVPPPSQKTAPDGTPTQSAHPARFSPDDKFSKQRVACKKRFGLLPTQKPIPEL